MVFIWLYGLFVSWLNFVLFIRSIQTKGHRKKPPQLHRDIEHLISNHIRSTLEQQQNTESHLLENYLHHLVNTDRMRDMQKEFLSLGFVLLKFRLCGCNVSTFMNGFQWCEGILGVFGIFECGFEVDIFGFLRKRRHR